jgi:hypothetical protein
MSVPRRQKKAQLLHLPRCAVAAAFVVVAICGRIPADAGTTERIVADALTGLALNGFDPVAYFTDRSPRQGEGMYEHSYGGVVWRFVNEGNRAAFARDPEVYMPRFGGYDPVALARGVALPGHPLIWLISGDRLYLFNRPENRQRFTADVAQSVILAEHHWPEIERTLVP